MKEILKTCTADKPLIVGDCIVTGNASPGYVGDTAHGSKCCALGTSCARIGKSLSFLALSAELCSSLMGISMGALHQFRVAMS
ncbi:hypothetical protein [Paraburkholderia sp. BCC1876]|uniref:hypothetical protein n=1 Tax=Paraburkholderia sp. BCC1876 TaxID=2676303 RepID=UPI00159267DD|nr:hypothetical protein [Paraburkholderia sp. BCC1876]